MGGPRAYYSIVSAAQIIEEIKALPPAERTQVIEFVTQLNQQPEVRYMDKETFRAAADEVFAKHGELLRRLAEHDRQ